MAHIFAEARLATLAFGLIVMGNPSLAAPAVVDATTVKAPGRFEFYQRQGLPEEYRGKTNPYQATVPAVIRGADRYNYRCAACHGLMGFGDGDASGAMRKRPADLAWSLSDPRVKDDYLFWAISEGGAQFGTNMPAYKKPDLAEWQIWEIITYMRAAFEGREARAPTPGGAQPAVQTVAAEVELRSAVSGGR
jgi:mono/diheme cytochrome c family protein